jgi:hypothetical protein
MRLRPGPESVYKIRLKYFVNQAAAGHADIKLYLRFQLGKKTQKC